MAMETASKQKDKEIVRLERRVDHSATKMRKSNDNAEKLVAQAQAKTDDVQAKNKQLKENLEVKIFLPQPHAPHESFCGYTRHSSKLHINHHYSKQASTENMLDKKVSTALNRYIIRGIVTNL